MLLAAQYLFQEASSKLLDMTYIDHFGKFLMIFSSSNIVKFIHSILLIYFVYFIDDMPTFEKAEAEVKAQREKAAKFASTDMLTNLPEDGLIPEINNNTTNNTTEQKEKPDEVDDLSLNYNPTNNIKEEDKEETIEEEHKEKIFFPLIKALIILNYMELLMQNENMMVFRDSIPLKLHFKACYDQLTEEEIQYLTHGYAPMTLGYPVYSIYRYFRPETLSIANANLLPELLLVDTAIPIDGIKELIATILEEANYYWEQQEKLRLVALRQGLEVDEESIKENDEESIASSVTSVIKPKTAKELRDEKRKKYQEQRQKANLQRAKVSMQRKYLYNLIQTDEISELFEIQARGDQNMNSAESWRPDLQNKRKNLRASQAEFSRMLGGVQETLNEINSQHEQDGEEPA